MDQGLAATARPTTDPLAPHDDDHGRAGTPPGDGARVPAQGLPEGHPGAGDPDAAPDTGTDREAEPEPGAEPDPDTDRAPGPRASPARRRTCSASTCARSAGSGC